MAVEKLNRMRLHDISVSISEKMPIYPGDPTVSIERVSDIAKGQVCNISRLCFGDHTGTHLDPPLHFIPGGKPVDQLDLNVLYGPARVVDMTRLVLAPLVRPVLQRWKPLLDPTLWLDVALTPLESVAVTVTVNVPADV